MLEKERKIAGLKKKKILRLSTRTMRRGREERKDRLAKNVNFFFFEFIHFLGEVARNDSLSAVERATRRRSFAHCSEALPPIQM